MLAVLMTVSVIEFYTRTAWGLMGVAKPYLRPVWLLMTDVQLHWKLDRAGVFQKPEKGHQQHLQGALWQPCHEAPACRALHPAP